MAQYYTRAGDQEKHPSIGGLASTRVAGSRVQDLASIIDELRTAVFKSLNAITNELNRRRIPTTRGGKRWYVTTVARLLARLLARLG